MARKPKLEFTVGPDGELDLVPAGATQEGQQTTPGAPTAATQAAQAAAQAQAESATSLTAQTPTQMTLTPQAPANPLTLQTPVQMTMPRVETPTTRDEFQQTVQQTPYGTVTGTISGRAPAPNPLAKEGVFQAAEAYRNLPANATPEQRAEAMAGYRGELQARVGASRGERAVQEYYGAPGQPGVFDVREARIGQAREAMGLPREYTGPQDVEYYKRMTDIKGPGIVQNVPSLRQQAIVDYGISQAAKEDRNLSRAILDAGQGGVDEKGKRTKPDRALLAGLQEEQRKFRLDNNLVDPGNPKAGLDIDYARQQRRNELLSSVGTITDVAKKSAEKRMEAQAKTKEPGKPKSSEQTRQELEQQAEQVDQERQAWLDQLRRRTATYYYA